MEINKIEDGSIELTNDKKQRFIMKFGGADFFIGLCYIMMNITNLM